MEMSFRHPARARTDGCLAPVPVLKLVPFPMFSFSLWCGTSSHSHFGKWPIWLGWRKKIENCSWGGFGSLFAIKIMFPMIWHYWWLLFSILNEYDTILGRCPWYPYLI
jgi:hypothetical protein